MLTKMISANSEGIRFMMTLFLLVCRGIRQPERDALLWALTEAASDVAFEATQPTKAHTAKQSPRSEGAKNAVAQGKAVPCCIVLSKVQPETCCRFL
jgi:hypothetical protein